MVRDPIPVQSHLLKVVAWAISQRQQLREGARRAHGNEQASLRSPSRAFPDSGVILKDADDVGCIAWNEKWGAWFVEWSKATGQIVGNVLPLRVIGNIYLVSKQPLDPQPT